MASCVRSAISPSPPKKASSIGHVDLALVVDRPLGSQNWFGHHRRSPKLARAGWSAIPSGFAGCSYPPRRRCPGRRRPRRAARQTGPPLPFCPKRISGWPPGENFWTKSPSKSTTKRLPSPSTATLVGALRSGTAPRATSTCQGELLTTTAVGPASPGVGVPTAGGLDSRQPSCSARRHQRSGAPRGSHPPRRRPAPRVQPAPPVRP